ncbi:MAG: putative toxin-antitoxin system toxin component, PIN family [Thermomicrobiales bacterium]|nr:putative toxin-antitoxin system toxin component, PIN family [Thermomicrobiales bacterium]
MIRAVVDTNILASAFARDTGSPRVVLDRWANQEFVLVTSEHIIRELERTLAKRYFRQYITLKNAERASVWIQQRAFVVRPIERVIGVATHPEDDLVLATAISGKADYLVTGDRQLLKLREFQGVRIVSAAEFLLVLSED